MTLALRGAFFISIILIFYLSLIPASELEFFNALSFIGDKISHGVIFFYISILGMFCDFKNQILYLHGYNLFFWVNH